MLETALFLARHDGSLLDRFAEDSRLRRRLARTEQRELIEAILAQAGAEIERSRKERTMDEFAEMAAREREATRIARRQWFWLHLAVYVPIQVMVFIIWNAVGRSSPGSPPPSSGGGSSSPCMGSTPS